MKSNGWGLNTLLIMIGVIVIFLLVATFFSIRLNAMVGQENNESEKKLQTAINQSYYINRINTMTEAAEKYILTNNVELSRSHYRLELGALIAADLINPITDYVTNNKCIGYSIAYLNEDNIKVIKSYIKCDNYESKGYGEV